METVPAPLRALTVDRLLADPMTALDPDRVDLVERGRAGAQLRFRAARDGRVVLEAALARIPG